MWSGFSSEIETSISVTVPSETSQVACGAASHLRLKLCYPRLHFLIALSVACGAASHLRLKLCLNRASNRDGHSRMWSGFSSEIETNTSAAVTVNTTVSHVERLLI